MTTQDTNETYIEWKNWTPGSFNTCSGKDAATYNLELRRSHIRITKNSQVLEIGFGNATFSSYVKRYTDNYVGIEKNEILVKRALESGIEAYLATESLTDVSNDRAFDLIAMFDVLEHLNLDDAIVLLTQASKCLSVDGRVIIRVPSGDSPFSGHLMHGDITHKLNLGRFAFFQLSDIAGLEVLSVRGAAYPIRGVGPLAALRRIGVIAVRCALGAALRVAYYANEPVVLAPTLTAVLRRKGGKSQHAA